MLYVNDIGQIKSITTLRESIFIRINIFIAPRKRKRQISKLDTNQSEYFFPNENI